MTQEAPQVQSGQVSSKSRTTTLILSLLGCVALCGIHRFYVGKTGTGILWLLTAGLLGIGQLVDMIYILTGGFKDKEGKKVAIW
jgi:TM2 domain-containing membrane protein YozV